MSLAIPRMLIGCTMVVCSAFLSNVSRGDDFQFMLAPGSTDGDATAQAAGRTEVKAVRSNNDRLSDASFAVFSHWPNLYGVYLFDTMVTGAGFNELQQHKHLIQVNLVGPNVNDDGVRAVAELPHVTHLQLGNGYHVSADCKYHVHHPLMTDRALAAVARMTNVAYLTIDNAAITDEGAQQLTALKSVRNIQFFRCTGLTVKGIERLRAALPRATITAHVPDIAPRE